MLKYLFIDTETTGLPFDYDLDAEFTGNWPRMVQLGFIMSEGRHILEQGSIIIRPDGYSIPWNATEIHGITTEYAQENGVAVDLALLKIELLCREADIVVGHNIHFDEHVIDAELCRAGKKPCIRDKEQICTMLESTDYCELPHFKWPKLCELYEILFDEDIDNAHDALADIRATFRCFWKLVDLGQISEPEEIQPEESDNTEGGLYLTQEGVDALDSIISNPIMQNILYLIGGLIIWGIVSLII